MVEETISNVSGVLGETVHNNRGYTNSIDSHDGGIDGPVVDQPTEARGILFFGGVGELLPERSESLAGEIPHAIRNLVRRFDDRRNETLAPPLQYLEVCTILSLSVSKERGSGNVDVRRMYSARVSGSFSAS